MKIEVIENSRALKCWILSKNNIPSHISEIINNCKNSIENLLWDKLYSTYLYWWYAQWSSNSIYSDLDIMLFFLENIDNTTKKKIIDIQDYLSNLYKDYFAYVWLDCATPELYKIKQPLVYGLLTKNLWIHIWGNSINNMLPDAYLDKSLWFQLNYDFSQRISMKYMEFINTNNDMKKHLASRWIMKKLLRTSFGIIIEKVDFFENSIDWLVDILWSNIPDMKENIKNIWDLVHNPTTDRRVVDNILKIYLPWLKKEWSIVYNK